VNSTRFTPEAAASYRKQIAEAGGIELFAIGRLNPTGEVAELEVHCRGTSDSVPALLSRPRPGEVVIHNHPSGVMEASAADMGLASRYGEDGVGVVITDNEVRRALWVVEPYRRELKPVCLDRVREVLTDDLARVIPEYEAREGQIDMALSVAQAFNEEHIAALEAGTGTGKSLAYLVPAVLWALENEGRVAISTYTLTLQNQLATADLPLLHKTELSFEHAVMKGRSNYLCRRKHAEALAEETEDEALKHLLTELREWIQVTPDGTRADLALEISEDNWERVASDHDQTLRARCPHFNTCFYYQARRQAARSQVLVLNHALLLADLHIKSQTGGDGILPRFDRVIIDEAHHLEDAATSLLDERVTARAVRRAIAKLLPRKGKAGALSRVHGHLLSINSPLDASEKKRVTKTTDLLMALLPELQTDSAHWMEQLYMDALSPEQPTWRLVPPSRKQEAWIHQLQPTIDEAAERLRQVARHVGVIDEIIDGIPPLKRPGPAQPRFELARAQARLADFSRICHAFSTDDPDSVKWIGEAPGRSKPPRAALRMAPVNVGEMLRNLLFDTQSTVVMTSATLTVRGHFDHFLHRVGLKEMELLADTPETPQTLEETPYQSEPEGLLARLETAVFPSPFDYARQALLALPRDFPVPDDPRFEAWVKRAVIRAIELTGGGLFVLCTSHQLVGSLHSEAQEQLGDRYVLLRQGQMGRHRLLDRFRTEGNAVLFGTDSFWEGVSVSGKALRMVLIPRLPFRVPTEPVQLARYERLEEQGLDPFRNYALPQAVLRLRQGVGRLIRTQRDRGTVLLLDRRAMERWYGRIFLGSLPPMQRLGGPMRAVLDRLEHFYRADEEE
jgi:ATP-dependent DNA helicase DinG